MAKKSLTLLIPPEGDKEVGVRVFEILEEILKDKENIGLTGKEGRWVRNHELVRGHHWRVRSRRVPTVTGNLLHPHIQRTVNELTDNNPTFNVVKRGELPDDAEEKINLIQASAEQWWNETEQQAMLEDSVRNGEDYGVAIEKMIFNSDLEGGIGEAETVGVDPFYFGFYPVKIKDPRHIQKAQALLFYYPMNIYDVMRQWPDFQDKIKPDSEIIKDLGDERREINSVSGEKTQGFMSRIGSTVREFINFIGMGEGTSDDVLMVECWCKDYTQTKEGKSKYKGNIRYILTCNHGDLVLEDRGNPSINDSLPDELAKKTYLYDKYPFAMANSIRDTSNAWGYSDVEQLQQLNEEFDKAISQLVLEKDRAARRKVVNPKTSGVDNSEFTNYPGILNPTNSQEAQAIRYLDIPAMPIDIQASITLFKDLFFLISGTFELDQARTPGREVIAYKAIAAILERAATMKRGKIRSYSRLIRERGRMYVSMMQNFYTEDRYVSLPGKNGRQEIKPIRGKDLIIPIQLTIVNGSTLPISKVQQREEAASLFKLRAIDQEDLLEKLEWENKNEIINRRNKGVYGILFEKLMAIGFPPELIRLFAGISQMDEKEFENSMKKGQIPTFELLMKNILQQLSGQPPQINPLDQVEIQVKQADIGLKIEQGKKIEADIMLTIEKIATERVEQEVRIAGIKYDEEELKIRRAELVKEIQKEVNERGASAGKTPSEKEKPGVYHERGMKSNNKESM